MLLALLSASLLHWKDAPPAFLDSLDTVKVWIPFHVRRGEAKPKVRISVDGLPIGIASVEATGLIGEPEAARPNMVVLAGSFQHLLGGADWSPGDASSEMKAVRPGVFEFLLRMPKGHYEYKIAVGGSWNTNYGAGLKPGGENVSIDVPKAGTPVRFLVDFNTHRLGDSVGQSSWVATPPDAPTLPAKPVPNSANVLQIRLQKPLAPSQVASNIQISVDSGLPRKVYPREVLSAPIFNHAAEDLGVRYTKSGSTFKVWSPVSTSVTLDLNGKLLPMKEASDGVWSRTVASDLRGLPYRFHFSGVGDERVAPDINAFAATPDGKWSVVADLASTNPPGWRPEPLPRISPTKLTIYEVHVRDFTVDASSQVPVKLRGKYLGMVADTGNRTGLNYLKWLGVNAVQLMPIEMFNPGHGTNYDWGYDTNLFNVPEPTYSTHPEDPAQTIREVKTMVAGLHRAGIRVIMDVVYNHSVPSEGTDSAFWQAVPYYYFRTDDRGQVLNESGVGNALDDDHPIVRKYIRESLCHWAREYGIDGFRFDLLGMFRKESILDWKKALDKIHPSTVLYGEPWTGGGPLRFGKGDQKGTGVGVFNDDYRNAIRGELDGPAPGFAMGGKGKERALAVGLAGSLDDFTSSPEETINFVSVHDNMTLWDKISLSMPKATEAERKQSLKLCGALVLLAQGVPFLEGGAELGRTKGGNNNTYNAGDTANRFDWVRAKAFMDVAETYRRLIQLRRTEPLLSLTQGDQIRDAMRFQLADRVVSFTLQADGRREQVAFKGSLLPAPVTVDGRRQTLTPLSFLAPPQK